MGTSSPDVTAPWLIAEVKSRKELPGWILDALAKARSHAKNGQLGIAVLHQRGMKDDLVVLKMSDFREWFGPEDPRKTYELAHEVVEALHAKRDQLEVQQ